MLDLSASFYRLFFLLRSEIRFFGKLGSSRRVSFRREVIEDEGINVTMNGSSRQLKSLPSVRMIAYVDDESEIQLNKFSACVIFRRDSQLRRVIMSKLPTFVADEKYKARSWGTDRHTFSAV